MADPSLMQTFYDLAEDEEACITGTTTLVEKLKTTASDSIVYSWKRLVKGTSSNRKNARRGFAIALTEVLTEFPDIDSEEVYNFCRSINLPTGHVSQKEIRDLYAGFIFCVSALHRSGRLKNTDLQYRVLKDLLPILFKKKLTIKDVVFKVFIDILTEIETKDLKNVIEIISDDLKEGWTLCTLERLAIMSYLEMRDASVVSKLLKKNWNYSHLNHPQNYEKIATVLKAVACEDFMKPQLAVYLDSWVMSKSFSIKKANKHFFKVLDSGENKNTVVFMLTHLVSSLSDDKIESFVNKNMMTFLLKPYVSSSESIQLLIDSVCKRIADIKCGEKKLSFAKTCLSLLPQRAWCMHKILDALFNTVKKEEVEQFTSLLESSFITPGEDRTGKVISEFRNDCLSWICQILRLSDAKIVFDFTKFLFIYSFFSVKGECTSTPLIKIPTPEISKVTTDFCKTKFNSCLKLLSASQSQDKSTTRKGLAEDGRYWVYHLLSSSLSLVTNDKCPMITDITEHEEWQTLWSVIDEVEAKTPESRSDEDWVFELLFLHAGLLFFEEQEQAKMILNDVNLCYEKHKNGSNENWKSVFVDLLISILSYESLMLRNIACGCFRLVCADLDEESIQLIMDAIESSDKSQDDDASDEGESSEDESDEEEGKENDGKQNKDEEMSEGDEAECSEDDDEDSSEDEEEESMDEDTDGVAEEEKSGDEIMGDDIEEEDINLSDADEEELKSEDKALGAAMKGLLDMKKQKKEEKRGKALKKVKMVHFKIKLLDLIEILVESVGFTKTTMNILPGLLNIVASPSVASGPVYNRVLGIFKSMFSMKPEKLTVNFSEALKNDVPAIQTFITKTSNKKAQQLAVQSLFMLCKVHLNNPQPSKKKRKSINGKEIKKDDEVYSVFKVLLQDFITNKNTKLDKNIFFQMIERLPVLRPNFTSDLTKYTDEDISLFAKMQSVNLLNRILSFGDELVLKSHSDILGAMGRLLTKLLNNENPSPHHIREVIKMCHKVQSAAKKNNVKISSIPEDLTTALEQVPFKSSISLKFPDIANLAKKVLIHDN